MDVFEATVFNLNAIAEQLKIGNNEQRDFNVDFLGFCDNFLDAFENFAADVHTIALAMPKPPKAVDLDLVVGSAPSNPVKEGGVASNVTP